MTKVFRFPFLFGDGEFVLRLKPTQDVTATTTAPADYYDLLEFAEMIRTLEGCNTHDAMVAELRRLRKLWKELASHGSEPLSRISAAASVQP